MFRRHPSLADEATDDREGLLEIEQPKRNWPEIRSTTTELAGICLFSAGFGWFSPGLGMIFGGISMVVVGLTLARPPVGDSG